MGNALDIMLREVKIKNYKYRMTCIKEFMYKDYSMIYDIKT